MTRFFLRLYLGIVLALSLAFVVILYDFLYRIELDGLRSLEGLVQLPVKCALDELHDAPPPLAQSRLDRLSAQLGYPVTFVGTEALGDLDADALRRLEAGQTVGTPTTRPPRFFTRLESGRILAIGPMPPIRPLYGSRGALSLFVVLVALLIAIPFILRPLYRQLTALSQAARRFGEGDFGARAEVIEGSATWRLARSFNDMALRIGNLIEGQQYLLRAVSHELRTPLCRLRYGLELVRATAGDQVDQRRFDAMDGDLSELDALIGELLLYTRLKEGGQPFVFAPGEWGALLEEVEGLFEEGLFPAKAAGSGDPPTVRLEVLPPERSIPGRMDVRYARRALQNLVGNAMRHARSRVQVSLETTPLGRVRIVVDDDGPGVPEEKREVVFEPFVRLDQSRAPGAAGVGLGLAIVGQIARWHGGRVWVERSPLGGARFVLELPVDSGAPGV